MLDWAWNNLVAYSLQLGLLVGLAAFVPALVRMQTARARLLFWQLLLLACLLLPAVRPWKRQALTGSVQVSSTTVGVEAKAGSVAQEPVPLPLIALTVFVAGFVIRLAWLAAGFLRLRHHRRRSVPLYPASTWGVEAELRVSHAIASPVTFGFRRPVVLLPVNFATLPEAMQNAVLCHEILHVRRGDWLFTVAEELVRAIFWFHPAIWWVLGEIQLAREQAVDRAVVEMTNSRDEYVDALLAIAGARPRLDLAPAPLFLRRRHLKQRVVSLFTERGTSKARLIAALTAGCAAVAMECWMVAGAFPLLAAPEMVPAAREVAPMMPLHNAPTPVLTGKSPEIVVRRAAIRPMGPKLPMGPSELPGPSTIRVGGNVQQSKLIRQLIPVYPPLAKQARISGVVHFNVRIAEDGKVDDIKVISGHPLLIQSALSAVKQWEYAPTLLNGTPVKVVTQVDVNFNLSEEREGGKQ